MRQQGRTVGHNYHPEHAPNRDRMEISGDHSAADILAWIQAKQEPLHSSPHLIHTELGTARIWKHQNPEDYFSFIEKKVRELDQLDHGLPTDDILKITAAGLPRAHFSNIQLMMEVPFKGDGRTIL